MYPIRRSRNIWAKTFTRAHTCSEHCNIQYEFQNNMIRIVHHSGCMYPEKIEPAFIHLSHRNSEDDVKFNDETVPLPRQVNLLIEHPLRRPRMFQHVFEEDEVVHLSTLVALFDKLYREVYAEEEQRATPKEFWVAEPCSECNDDLYTEEHIDEFVHAIPETPNTNCSICFEPGDLVQVRHCQHVYHRDCLLRWFNTPRVDAESVTEHKSNSCPMCRQPLIVCNSCHSERSRKTRFFGAVPPFQPNNLNQEDRPETDGPYGIHSLYYEELFFKGIFFDVEQQLVRLLLLERIDD